MLSLRTRRGPVTGSLKTPVKTVFPCQGTSFGMPTLTDSRVPTGWVPVWRGWVGGNPELMLTCLRKSQVRQAGYRPSEYLARREASRAQKTGRVGFREAA